MYFAMDEIGHENARELRMIRDEAGKWAFVYETAKDYGFEGIHLTPSLYKEFGLDLSRIPQWLQDFRLTLHLGGMYRDATRAAYQGLDDDLSDAFEIAAKNHMHDISVHPPFVRGMTPEERAASAGMFDDVVSKWVDIAKQNNMTFSLETHVSGEYFLFNGLEAYAAFADRHPNLGILIDISHNCYDGFSEDEILGFFKDRNVKALHVSDALPNAEFRAGTHLPVGEGTIDFAKLITGLHSVPGIYCALEIKSGADKLRSSLDALRAMLPA